MFHNLLKLMMAFIIIINIAVPSLPHRHVLLFFLCKEAKAKTFLCGKNNFQIFSKMLTPVVIFDSQNVTTGSNNLQMLPILMKLSTTCKLETRPVLKYHIIDYLLVLQFSYGYLFTNIKINTLFYDTVYKSVYQTLFIGHPWQFTAKLMLSLHRPLPFYKVIHLKTHY